MMTQSPPPQAAGMVFRRCQSPSEKQAAGRLLAEHGVRPEEPGLGGTELFGLWDLTARAGEGLVGAAATRSLWDRETVQLSGIAVKTGLRRLGLGRRLITEVADALRAQGAARLVAGSAGGDDSAAALLRGTGFVRAGTEHGLPYDGGPRVPPEIEATWWELEL